MLSREGAWLAGAIETKAISVEVEVEVETAVELGNKITGKNPPINCLGHESNQRTESTFSSSSSWAPLYTV